MGIVCWALVVGSVLGNVACQSKGSGEEAGLNEDGLVVWYSFDEDHGSQVKDRSGSANTGVVVGDVTWSEVGRIGGGCRVRDGEIRIPGSESLAMSTEMTISLWIKSEEVPDVFRPLVSSGWSESGSFILGIDNHWSNEALVWDIKNVAGTRFDANQSNLITPNMWQLVTVTYDGQELRLYVDGELQRQAAASGSLGGGIRDLRISRTGTPGQSVNGSFVGLIDEVRVFNRALNEREIHLIMTQPGRGERDETEVVSSHQGDGADSPPGVIVIISDALRAQNLGLYGYARPTSPFLDTLCTDALVYEQAYSHYSYTWPTIANLFTGDPYSALTAAGKMRRAGAQPGGGLAAENLTLAEMLHQRGVATAGVSANPFVLYRNGFSQGFDDWHDVERWGRDGWHKFTVWETNKVGIRFLRRLVATGKPWLLYLHYFDTHNPYIPPEQDRTLFEDPGYDRTGRVVFGEPKDADGERLKYLTPDKKDWFTHADRNHLVAQYDGEIHHFDRGLRALMTEIEQMGLRSSTSVIITSDHGETFFDYGYWGHGYLSRGEEEHIPLLVSTPASIGKGRRLSQPVTTTDLFFSILGYFGVPDPASYSPIPWSTDVLSGRSFGPQVAYSEGPDGARILRDGRYSYYRYLPGLETARPLPVPRGESMFDLSRDPLEHDDLFKRDHARAVRERDRLFSLLGNRDLPESAGGEDPFLATDGETAELLRALGYLK